MEFDNFDPSHFAFLRKRVRQSKSPLAIVAEAAKNISEAEERSAQAELHLITGKYQRVVAKAKVQALKLAKKYEAKQTGGAK